MGLITPEGRASFVTVLKPKQRRKKDGTLTGEPKFSLTLVLEPGTDQKYLPGKVDISALKAAVIEAAKEKFGDKLEAMIKKGTFKSPFIEVDEEQHEKYGYPLGAILIRITTTAKPNVVSKYKGSDGKPTRMSDDEVESQLYAGAYCRCSVNVWAYDNEQRGVSFFLNNIQVLGDGPERWDGRRKAEDEFEATADAADLEETPVEPSGADLTAKAAALATVAAPAAKKSKKSSTDLSDLL